MIEWYNLVGFVAFTVVLVWLDWFITNDSKKALSHIPVAMVFSILANAVWIWVAS